VTPPREDGPFLVGAELVGLTPDESRELKALVKEAARACHLWVGIDLRQASRPGLDELRRLDRSAAELGVQLKLVAEGDAAERLRAGGFAVFGSLDEVYSEAPAGA